MSASSLAQGDGLHVYGSPYGLLAPHVFFNCLATGVVSGRLEAPPPLVHDDHHDDHRDGQAKKSSRPQPQPWTRYPLLLTDARCIPGCEGGPAFNDQRQFAGVPMPPPPPCVSCRVVRVVRVVSCVVSCVRPVLIRLLRRSPCRPYNILSHRRTRHTAHAPPHTHTHHRTRASMWGWRLNANSPPCGMGLRWS